MANGDAALRLPNPTGIEKNLSFLGLPELPKSRKSADIHRVILEHKASIQDCYTRVLKDSPNLNGEIKVRLTISPSGKVTAAALLASTVNHAELENLILERISRWNDFGEVSPGAGNVTFKQSFVFGQQRKM
jgi:TonB family protein